MNALLHSFNSKAFELGVLVLRGTRIDVSFTEQHLD